MKYIKPNESKDIKKNELDSLKNFKNFVNEHYMDGIDDDMVLNPDDDDDMDSGMALNHGDDDMDSGMALNHGDSKYPDDIVEFKIPEWALSALINGDYSGLSDEDEVKLNAFIKKTVEQFGNANFMLADDDDRDYGFCHSNDIDNLGSNCEKLLLRATKGI